MYKGLIKLLFCFGTLSLAAAELPQIELYYMPRCPHSQKVLSYLKKQHKTLPMKNVENNSTFKKELKEQGGKLEVPCLIVDGMALYGEDPIVKWMGSHQAWLTDESPL